MRTTSSRLFVTAISLVALAATERAAAQQPATPATTRSYVQVIRLKPDMLDEWIALQKNEVLPALKKAGVPSRTALSTVVGNSFEYTMISPFPSWSAFDGDSPLVRALGAAAAAQLNAKLRRCVLTQSSFMTTPQSELSVVPATNALVWRVVVRRALPGKLQEYLAHYKADILPAMQRAKAEGKIAGAGIATRGVGASAGEFTTVTFYDKFAGLDGPNPLVAMVGQEAATKLGEKANLSSTVVQTVVRRRVADLSY